MGPRRKLQLAMIVSAVAAILLALTGWVDPTAAGSLPVSTVVDVPKIP
ncbi:hypothetical protein [Pseudonocardia nigra]|nr:hypothetical protein [Pseudonocardia nigra]